MCAKHGKPHTKRKWASLTQIPFHRCQEILRTGGLEGIMVFPNPANITALFHNFDVGSNLVVRHESPRPMELRGWKVLNGNLFDWYRSIVYDLQDVTATVDVKPDYLLGSIH